MIYTSYFENINQIPSDLIPIAICGKSPEWYKGLQYKKLAPKHYFFAVWKETHDNAYYEEHFRRDVLQKLDIVEVLKDLHTMGEGKDVVLLCYEKPTEFCHRSLVRDWFLENGIKCKELIFNNSFQLENKIKNSPITLTSIEKFLESVGYRRKTKNLSNQQKNPYMQSESLTYEICEGTERTFVYFIDNSQERLKNTVSKMMDLFPEISRDKITVLVPVSGILNDLAVRVEINPFQYVTVKKESIR